MSTKLTLEIRADTAGIREVRDVLRDLKTVAGSSSVLAKGFKELKRDSLGLRTEMASLASSVTKYGNSAKRGSTDTDKLSRKVKQLKKENRKLAASVRKLEVALTKESAAMRKVSSSATTMRDSIRGAAAAGGSLWMAYGQLLPLMATYATVASAISGIKIAAEFESQTVYMNAVAEATGDYTLSLSDLRTELLSIKNVVHTPSELAEASKELVKSGFDAAVAVGEMASMSRTATAVQEDLAVVTKGTAKQFRAWNVAAVGAHRGVSSLAQVSNMTAAAVLSSATNYGEMNKMLQKTTELAPLSNAAFSEILASLGGLTSLGLNASQASTALRTSILKLYTPTKELAQQLAEIDVPFSAFTESGKKKDILTLFKDLGKSLASMSEQSRTSVMKDLFDLRALKAGSGLLTLIANQAAAGGLDFQKLETSIRLAGKELTFVGEIFGKVSAATSGTFDLLRADVIRDVTLAFEDTNNEVASLLDTMRELVADGSLRVFIDGLASATGSFITLVKLAAKFHKLIIATGVAYAGGKIALGLVSIIGWLKKARAGQIAFNIATLANPWVAGAAVLAGAASFTYLYVKGLGNATEATERLIDKTDSLATALQTTNRAMKGPEIPVSDVVQQWSETTQAWVDVKLSLDDSETKAFMSKLNQIGVSNHGVAGAAIRASSHEYAIPYQLPQQPSGKGKADETLYDATTLRWQAQNALSIEEKGLKATARARASVNSQTLKLFQARLNSQEISEAQYLENSRALRSEDLSLRITEAASLVELEKKRLDQAKEVTASAIDKNKLSALTKQAAALQKVVDAENKLDLLKDEKLLEPVIIEAEEVARLLTIEASLRGITTEAGRLRADAAQLQDISTMGSVEADYTTKLKLLAREKEDALAEFSPAEAGSESYEATVAAHAKKLEAERAYFAASQTLRRDASAGVTKSVKDYIQSAGDEFTNFGEVAANALQSTEDALVDLAMTGKFSFKEFANSIISDLTRIYAKKILVASIESAGASSGIWGTILSGLTTAVSSTSTTPTASTSTFGLSNYDVTATTMHRGGLVGGPVSSPTSVNSSVFNGAPRLHDGLKYDEFPAILQRGEEVISKRDVQNKGATPGIQVNVINTGDDKKEATASTRYDDMKNLIIDVVLTDIGSGGPLRAATQGGRGI